MLLIGYILKLFIMFNIGRTYSYRLTFARASSARPSRQLGFPTVVLLILLSIIIIVIIISSPLEVVQYVFLLFLIHTYYLHDDLYNYYYLNITTIKCRW